MLNSTLNFLSHGVLNLSWWSLVITVLVFTQITIFAVTIYLHRCQAHKALDLHPIVSHIFRLWLWLGTGMRTIEWVAIHRKHHVKCETEEDPHSPQIHGIKKLLWDGTDLYRKESRVTETMEKYGKGCPNDWMENNIYRFSKSGIALMLIVNILLFGVIGITVWAIQMVWIPFWAAGVVNGIGHYAGYRNFETEDASRNIIPFGLFIGGEELHNNHHTYPTSAKFSVKWWEVDIAWGVISVLRVLRLAKVRKVAPKLAQVSNKAQVDMETLKALFANHFQIMSRYSKDVLLPVLNQEKIKADVSCQNLFEKAKKLIKKHSSQIDDAGKQSIASLLSQSASLELVYQYRENLQAIWKRTSSNPKELVEALQEWCKQAEATGIDALQRFSDRLKTYVVQPQPQVG